MQKVCNNSACKKKENMDKRLFRCMAVVLFMCLCFTYKETTLAEEIQPEAVYVPEQTTEEVLAEDPEAQVMAEQLTQEQLAAILLTDTITQVTAAQSTRQLVIIGDSRTVGMKGAVGSNNNIWSAKVGMGLSWMKNTGVPAVEASINENTDVVILMGVNDVRSLSMTKKYISYLNTKAAAWTALGANVYYVSVNPMVFETSSYPGITNSLIENWNTRMQQGLSSDITYIDTYSKVNGQLSSKDGIHYNNKSYKLIYNTLNQEIINDKVTKQILAMQQPALDLEAQALEQQVEVTEEPATTAQVVTTDIQY